MQVVYGQHDELACRVCLAKQNGKISTDNQRVGGCQWRVTGGQVSACDQLADQPVGQRLLRLRSARVDHACVRQRPEESGQERRLSRAGPPLDEDHARLAVPCRGRVPLQCGQLAFATHERRIRDGSCASCCCCDAGRNGHWPSVARSSLAVRPMSGARSLGDPMVARR